MTLDTEKSPATAKKLPQGRNAAEVWDAMFQAMGMAPMSAEEAANYPPQTEEEEAAFERAINETCERIEEPRALL